jgi:GT2 family glycosyltransferase
MLKERPLISLITINYNTTHLTCDLLRSINEHNTYQNLEVIVVDNASKEDPSQLLKAVYPNVQLILNGINAGFSGGNNAGIKVAKGDYLFLINNDTEFTPGLIEGLLEVFAQYPDAGVVSPKFHFYFQKGTIEYAGYKSVSILTGRTGMIGRGEKDEGQYNKVQVTSSAHGGGMMVSRKVIEEVGLLYEPYFLYYEELDWSEQIKRKGYKIYFQPKALIYHKESMTTGKESPLKTFYLTRNRVLFMQRNMSWFAYIIFLLYFSFFPVPKNTLVYFIKGQMVHLKSFWKGIIWHFNPKVSC